jgi:hypothetical protein
LNPHHSGDISRNPRVKPKLFSSILLEDIPILNDVYQADFTLNYVAAEARARALHIQ